MTLLLKNLLIQAEIQWDHVCMSGDYGGLRENVRPQDITLVLSSETGDVSCANAQDTRW